MRLSMLALAALAPAVLAAAALGGRSSLPSRFPATWTTTASVPAGITRSAGTLMGVEPSTPGTLVVHTVDELRAGKQLAYAYKELKQHRVKGGTVTCGGKSYTGPYTMDLSGKAGSGWFGFVTLPGAIQLAITHEVEVAPTATGPPSCREDSGTWVGNIPPLAGKHGTWTESTDGVFTFG